MSKVHTVVQFIVIVVDDVALVYVEHDAEIAYAHPHIILHWYMHQLRRLPSKRCC